MNRPAYTGEPRCRCDARRGSNGARCLDSLRDAARILRRILATPGRLERALAIEVAKARARAAAGLHRKSLLSERRAGRLLSQTRAYGWRPLNSTVDR
jgi:hypothetical protein